MELDQHQDPKRAGIHMNQIYLDVSHLAAPEPMTKIIEALSHLSFGQYLKVKHRRQPFPLFSILKENDWEYRVEVHSDEHISLFIFHKNDISLFEDEALISTTLPSKTVTKSAPKLTTKDIV